MNKYRKWAMWKDVVTGAKHSYATEDYMSGIYIIWDNDPARQGGTTYQKIKKLEKDLSNNTALTDLCWGPEVECRSFVPKKNKKKLELQAYIRSIG
jgi:hypothetical protein